MRCAVLCLPEGLDLYRETGLAGLVLKLGSAAAQAYSVHLGYENRFSEAFEMTEGTTCDRIGCEVVLVERWDLLAGWRCDVHFLRPLGRLL